MNDKDTEPKEGEINVDGETTHHLATILSIMFGDSRDTMNSKDGVKDERKWNKINDESLRQYNEAKDYLESYIEELAVQVKKASKEEALDEVKDKIRGWGDGWNNVKWTGGEIVKMLKSLHFLSRIFGLIDHNLLFVHLEYNCLFYF